MTQRPPISDGTAARLARIGEKLNRLRQKDADLRVFGAGRHQYLARPTLSEEQIFDWEWRHGVSLPEEYRAYLATIGDGGVGPCYGVLPLASTPAGRLDEPFPHTGPSELAVANTGALVVCHEGCGYEFLLVVRGAEHGAVWYDERAGGLSLAP